jgi:hypothetical protein
MKMDNVVPLNVATTLDIPAEQVLSAAQEAELETVLILAVCKDGEHYEASTTGHAGQLLWLMERFRHKLMAGDFD